MANKYYNRFTKVLREQDEDPALTDAEALDAELSDITSDELGADLPDDASGSPLNNQQKQMYDELNSWITKMDEFASYLNGTDDSIQTTLNSAEPDTIFDSISNSETKKIARVAMEVMSLSEILKGYLAGANDPKYRFN
jgi:hypothetical protein|tara:strand:- start:8792 stop:9208 length:417 start_codon:yes stop_codon:yes gene_type:complete